MIKRIMVFIPLALFVVLAFFLWRGLDNEPRDIPSVLIDKSIPNFILEPLLPNQPNFTHEQLRGKVSIVNIWGSWCPPCLDEHPVFMHIANQTDIPVYGINYKDERENAITWLSRYGNPFTLIGYDPNATVAMDWGVYGAPETFIVDAEGVVRYRHVGIITFALWETEMLPLIAALTPALKLSAI